MTFSFRAIAAATALAGSSLLAVGVAQAQPAQRQEGQPQQGDAAQPAPRQLTLSRAELAAVTPLQAALRASDWAAAQAALPAAQAAAQGADARQFVARATWQVGNRNNNTQLEIQGLDQLIALPNTLPNELPVFLNRRAELAFAAQDYRTAEQSYLRLVQINPSDAASVQNLSVVRRRMGNNEGALEPILQRISEAEARGERPEEALYRRAFGLAAQARQAQPTLDHGIRLLRAYPSASNWRDVLTVYRQLSNLDAQFTLDVMRLIRAAGALNGEADYITLAQQASQAGLPGETRAVLEEGIQRGSLQRTNPNVTALLPVATRRIEEDRVGLPGQISQARSASTGRQARVVADALYGYGRFAEAAELYRLALSKGGEDANVVNTRLGAALAMGGQRAEAETAFRAVTGERARLAAFWLAWLAGRPS